MGMDQILGLLLVCLSSVSLQVTADMMFNYEAEIKAGGDFPSPSASIFFLRGLIAMQSTEDKHVLQFSNLTASLYNGALDTHDQHHTTFLPLSDSAIQLLTPFTVHKEYSQVIGLSGVDGEADWSVNMKRSVASLLHMKERGSGDSAHFAQENGLHGQCNVEYTVSTVSDTRMVTRKVINHNSCVGQTPIYHSNAPTIFPFCTSGQDDYLSSTSEVTYTRDSGKLTTVEARGAIYVQPLKSKGELQQILSHQRLSVISGASIPTPLVAPAGKIVELKLQQPSGDFTQGRNPMKPAAALASVKKLLQEIADRLDAEMDRDPNKLHDERVSHILFFMSKLEKEHLMELFQEYSVGTSYQQETLKKIYMALLPKVGTKNSILLIRDLITENGVNSGTAKDLLNNIPFYLREPSEELLSECEIFYNLGEDEEDDVRSSGVLAFATLVFHTCKGHCSPERQEKYVQKYVELFKAAKTYGLQMLYLGGLSNMEDGKVFEYLAPVIKSHENNHLRFLAVWASMNKAIFHPKEVDALYWPILTNRNETLEMRVAALTMLFVSQPSTGRFFSLHWFMTSEPDQHLQHFYYTTLQSLVNTKDPCYSLMSGFAGKVLRLLPPPSERHWSTGNYILDHGNSEYGFGGIAQLFLIANQKTELPNVIYLLAGAHAVGQRISEMAVYLKLDGISNAVKERLSRIDPNNVNIPQLADILRKIKAAPSTSTPVHFELLIKKQGRAFISVYLNDTTFHKIADVIAHLQTITIDQHVNVQVLDNELLTERVIMTDIGMPSLFFFSTTSVGSLRGNVSQEAKPTSLTLKRRLEFRWSATGMGNLMFYNPVIDIWHGGQRSSTIHMNIPVEGGLEYDSEKSQIIFNIIRRPDVNPGFIVHIRSAVLTRSLDGDKTLRSYCESCKALAVISRGSQYRREKELLDLQVNEVGVGLKVDLFDCEHFNGIQVFRSLVRGQNYQVFPVSQPLLIMGHMIDSWMIATPPGSCGTEVRLTTLSSELTELRGFIQLPSSKTPHTASLVLGLKTGSKILHSWTFGGVWENESPFYKVGLLLVRESESENQDKFCVEALVKIPSPPSNKLLVKASEPLTGQASFHWTTDSTTNTCGSDSTDKMPLEVNFIAETSEEQATLASKSEVWPFRECKAGNNAKACHLAAHEMTTLRNYTVSVNYSSPLEPELFTFGRGYDGQLVASIEVPVNRPVVVMRIGRDEFTVDIGSRWIEPFLINTRYPALQKVAMDLGLISPAQT